MDYIIIPRDVVVCACTVQHQSQGADAGCVRSEGVRGQQDRVPDEKVGHGAKGEQRKESDEEDKVHELRGDQEAILRADWSFPHVPS